MIPTLKNHIQLCMTLASDAAPTPTRSLFPWLGSTDLQGFFPPFIELYCSSLNSIEFETIEMFTTFFFFHKAGPHFFGY